MLGFTLSGMRSDVWSSGLVSFASGKESCGNYELATGSTAAEALRGWSSIVCFGNNNTLIRQQNDHYILHCRSEPELPGDKLGGAMGFCDLM